jgi:hypothetical protein
VKEGVTAGFYCGLVSYVAEMNGEAGRVAIEFVPLSFLFRLSSAEDISMSIVATCQCGREFHVKSAYAGKSGKCPSCGTLVTFPAAAAAMPASVPPEEVWPPMPEPRRAATPQHAPRPAPQQRMMMPPPEFAAPEMMPAPPLAGGRGKVWAVLIAAVVVLGGGAFGAYQLGWFGKSSATAANPPGPPAPTTPGGALILRISSPDPTAVKIDHPQTIELKTKFVPGLYDLTESMGTRMNMTVAAQGQTMSIGSSSKMTLGGDVSIGGPDTNREQLVKFTCRSVKMTSDTEMPGKPNQTESFDSDSTSNPPSMLADMLSPMIGWEGRSWTRDGKFTRADGLLSLMDRMRAAAPPEAHQMLGNMEKQLSEFLKEMLTQHWGEVLPQNPVAPGAKWKTKMKIKSVPMLGAMDVDCECMLHRIERGSNGAKVAVVGFTASSQITNRDLNLSEMMPGAPPAHVSSLTITEYGLFYFDTEIGLSTRVAMEGSVIGSMTMTDPGSGEKAQMSMNVNLDVNDSLSRNTTGPRPPPASPRVSRRNGTYIDEAKAVPQGFQEVPPAARTRESIDLPAGEQKFEDVDRAKALPMETEEKRPVEKRSDVPTQPPK